MARLKGQAFDTESMYGKLGKEGLEHYANETGFSDGGMALDAEKFFNFVFEDRDFSRGVLEVGCAYGRFGKYFLDRGVDYYGIDLHLPYIQSFRRDVSSQDKKRIFHGNFLNYSFSFEKIEVVLFPWSVIGDFSLQGQIKAFSRCCDLLSSKGSVFLDIPKDIVNKVGGYSPGPLNILKVHDIESLGFIHSDSIFYETLSGRNREIIKISKIN